MTDQQKAEQELVEKIGKELYHWWDNELVSPNVIVHEMKSIVRMLSVVKANIGVVAKPCKCLKQLGNEVYAKEGCRLCHGTGVMAREDK